MPEPVIEKDPYVPITSRIGRVAAAWARLEFRTNEIIWHLANVDIEYGACLTSQIQSPSSRFRALVALVTLRGGKQTLIGELNSFSTDLDSLARQRNRFVHDPWIASNNPDSAPRRVEVTADRRLRFEAVETTLTRMDELWHKISEAIVRLESLYTRIKTELPPWPDTQYVQSLDKHPIQERISPDNGS